MRPAAATPVADAHHLSVRLLRFLLITVLASGVLAASGLALVPAARQLSQAGSAEETPVDLGPLDQRSYVYAANGRLLATLKAEVDRQPVPLETIPSHVVDAILAVEDADFFAHRGVNLRSMLRALTANVESGATVQGGSTITQQLIKNEIVGDEQTIDRKAKEAVLARRLEETMSKEEILERYLNTVYLGNGAYGVQAGAETYFGVGVAELDVAQAALLAGMIANPSRFDPVRHPEAAKGRRDLALRRLVAYGRLTEEEAEALRDAPLPTRINQVNPTPDTYFVEEVKQQLLRDPRLGRTREEREYAVFRGGLQIHTTLDPLAQFLATAARDEVIAELAPEGAAPATIPIAPHPVTGEERFATAAVVSVDPATGAVRAMVGGSGFEENKFNVTTQGLRSGGSTFKVFVLMALLEAGYVPDDSVDGSGPCSFTGIPGLDPDPYVVENFGNSRGGGGTITQQTLRSSNCAYVRLGQIVGTRRVAEQARRMGITTPIQDVVSMPLGTQEVYPIDMAAAFASIANDGIYNPPYYIERVLDRNGRLIFEHEPNPRRASSPESARLAADVLEKNVQSGTGTRARIPGHHAAGKTGTAQNSGNGWFVGFTPHLSTAVWMGSPADNYEVRIRGVGITGGSYPAEIWGRYMRAWHQDKEPRDHPDPPRTRPGRYLRMDSVQDPRSGGSRPRRPAGTTTTTEAAPTTEADPATTSTPPTTAPPAPTTSTPSSTPTTAAPPGGGDGGDDGGDG